MTEAMIVMAVIMLVAMLGFGHKMEMSDDTTLKKTDQALAAPPVENNETKTPEKKP